MIETLSIRNFKVLREVDLELKPLTVIVGPNASGKSTILQALSMLARLTSGGRGEMELPPLLRSQSTVLNDATTLHCSGVEGRIKFSFGYRLYPDFEFLRDDRRGQTPIIGSSCFRLDPQKLSEPSEIKDQQAFLPNNGDGLASYLAGLSLEYPDQFRELVQLLSTVIPTIKNVRMRKARVRNEVFGFELLFDTTSAEALPAKFVSEGSLLTLALLTALTTRDMLQLVLIDDFERGLHPRALKDLVQALRSLQEKRPDLQIVTTTHSPYLLDNFKPEEVLLTSLDDSGYAVVKPLTAHPDFERWRGYMTSGEFWSSVGEDWVAHRQPPTPNRRKAKTA